jgi:hypothetical protein
VTSIDGVVLRRNSPGTSSVAHTMAQVVTTAPTIPRLAAVAERMLYVVCHSAALRMLPPVRFTTRESRGRPEYNAKSDALAILPRAAVFAVTAA